MDQSYLRRVGKFVRIFGESTVDQSYPKESSKIYSKIYITMD